jgi:gamma-glutamyltranspeptidase / glutathione hydrolase
MSQLRSPTVHAPNGMVCSVDHLASSAGVAALRAGGSAADAAVCASAVLAVTTQHMCGMGGDLFALVHHREGAPDALAAAGRAGAGSDAAAMRAEGLTAVPLQGDLRAAPVPGCVDGWIALHERHGRLPLAEVLEPARRYAAGGFPASPLLALSSAAVRDLPGAEDYRRPGGLRAGDLVRRPQVAEILAEVAAGGRAAFYEGRFGAALVDLGQGLWTEVDLEQAQAAWVEPIGLPAWDHDVWTVPPPSQGYLVPAAAWMAAQLDLPDDPADGAWAHLLAEAARWAGHDRPAVLHDRADGAALLDEGRLRPRLERIDPERRTSPPAVTAPGGTIFLCAVDGDGMGVSLIQSNASGWGCHVVVPGTGIFLHDRGIGFRLDAGHPAELAPGRVPPHTLAPALVTRPDGSLAMVVGTMGGDTQPQVVLQLLARTLRAGESPGRAVSAPRWILGVGGFDTWEGDGLLVTLEASAPERWLDGLAARGHHVERGSPRTNVGHAHLIRVGDRALAGATDPRALSGAAAGW